MRSSLRPSSLSWKQAPFGATISGINIRRPEASVDTGATATRKQDDCELSRTGDGGIDGLVAKKKRLIELLREKRAALITRAVTKGLDPAASL